MLQDGRLYVSHFAVAAIDSIKLTNKKIYQY